MQISESWLREYANPALDTEALVAQLTMAGLEVDGVMPVAPAFNEVVVGEVLAMEKHPDADRLRVCQVAVGGASLLQIVCGAANVRVGLKIPAAMCGAVLPGDFKIKKSTLRGVESFGMLCSAKELGLASEAEGLWELPVDAPVGMAIREYLALDDCIIDVDLTPNRTDCLSVEGLAREIAVLNRLDMPKPTLPAIKETTSVSLPVTVAEPAACPRYLGRMITGVNNAGTTPLWMQERLRRSGLRSLSPVVDVTNYVLLELGQPLHAFDAAKIAGGICVRRGYDQETLALLNGQTLSLDQDALVIADQNQALALAGVMGGSASAVNATTETIFLECAFFSPQTIAGKARRYGLHTDSSHRFERGVDATLQERALARATQLILDLVGGQAGPVTTVVSETHLPARSAILLRKSRLEKILGIALEDDTVTDIFQRLGMKVEIDSQGWLVTAPGFRFDITIEADLIEEVARIIGYNQLPSRSLTLSAELQKQSESVLDMARVADLLVDRGYQEAITYSFVDEDIQRWVDPQAEFIRLQNPISSELSIMRTSLWCGLLKAALYNAHRQQNRIRLFENGLCFIARDGAIQQQNRLAGLMLGEVLPEQWGTQARKADFFDAKADVEALFVLTGQKPGFKAAEHPALHPGQSAEIVSASGEVVGWLGMLHPTLEKQLDFDSPVFLFEIDQAFLLNKRVPHFKPLSKFPSVRRDLALIVNESVTADQVMSCIKNVNNPILQDVTLFDLYCGKGVEEGCKSLAISLHLQDEAQTLTEAAVDTLLTKVLSDLSEQINAKLRD